MKRRTFLKWITAFSSIVAVSGFSGHAHRENGNAAIGLARNGFILHGRSGGCSSPTCNDSSAVHLENALPELEKRRI